jgi:peptidoglycan/LPS O-acetylase OafA/YrhL
MQELVADTARFEGHTVQTAAGREGLPSRTSSRFYLPQLDGLRFLAFAVVFYHHFFPVRNGTNPWLVAMAEAGRLGVDLFFVLSSFLITSLLLREQDARDQIDVPAFWVRRILRIWPLYFAFVAGAAVVERPVWWYLAGLLTFTMNWTVLGGWYPSVTSHLWSISIEEQFYFGWPLVVRWTPRRALPWVCLGMIAVAITTRAVLVSRGLDASAQAIWVNTAAHLDPLAIGGLVALAWARRPWTLPAGTHWLALAGASVALTLIQHRGIVPIPSVHQIWTYLVSAVILGGVVAATAGSQSGLLASRPLVYLGRISYGLYVFHMPVLTAFEPFTDLVRWVVRLPLAFGLTLAVAALSYRFLEQPFLRLKERFTYVRSAPPSGDAAGSRRRDWRRHRVMIDSYSPIVPSIRGHLVTPTHGADSRSR